ncbi:MAG: FlgK family flagellar hook-associated protein [Paracoccaceae bacterium]
MTISGSLSNALSGLRAAARGAEVVSANVANAMTESYGQRELSLSAASLGGNGAGVAVVGIHRSVDQQTISERRLVEASLGQDTVQAEFLNDLKNAIGTPDDSGSLTGRLSTLEANLIEAASRPDSETRLAAIVNAATSLTNHLNSISDKIQASRMQADQEISRQVSLLNESLGKVSDLNKNIRRQIALGHDANALMDQRQKIVDQISSIVPINEIPRSNGEIALYTAGGAILLDGRPATISFTSVGIIVPEMTLGSGALSGLLYQPAQSLTCGCPVSRCD